MGLKEKDPEISRGVACREHPDHREQEFLEISNIVPFFPSSGPPVFWGWKGLGFLCSYFFRVQGQVEHPLHVQRYNFSPLAICEPGARKVGDSSQGSRTSLES